MAHVISLCRILLGTFTFLKASIKNSQYAPQPFADVHGLGTTASFIVRVSSKRTMAPRMVVIDDEELSHARLSLYSLEGERLRSYTFPDLPPSIIGNRIGCYDWLYYQHSRGEALFASFYQSPSMNSECSLAFLLKTGEILWRKDQVGVGDYGRGVGAWGTSAIHNNIANLLCKGYTVPYRSGNGGIHWRTKVLTVFTADAMKSADNLSEQTLSTSSSIEDPFTAYGTPIINGDDEIIGGCFGGSAFSTNQDCRSGGIEPRLEMCCIACRVLAIWMAMANWNSDRDMPMERFESTTTKLGALRASLDLKAICTDVLTLNSQFIIGTNDGKACYHWF